jgi:putative oxidoreductase
MKRIPTIVYWFARVVAALLMLQTLYFKFTASEESVYIFQTVGLEPVGRLSVGVVELVASVLILINSTAWIGASLAIGLMMGAIASHLFVLGISVKGDGGQLFIYAVLVLICSLYVIFVNKTKVVQTLSRITS